MSGRREHFGPCNVFSRDDERFPASRWTGLYPTMEGAICALDTFQVNRRQPRRIPQP